MKIATVALAIAGVVVIVSAMGGRSLAARAQPAPGFEYLRVAPYLTHARTSATSVIERRQYQACAARQTEWFCRDFEAPNATPQRTPNEALRAVLATLGAEGWELVAVVNEDTSATSPLGVAYMFKRLAR